MTLLLLLVTTASAQLGGQFSSWVPDGKECAEGMPIAGTAGFANGQQALRTAAVTYTATRFAEKIGAERIEPSDDDQVRVTGGYEVTTTYQAARVPSFHAGAGTGNCAAKYRVGARPIDVQSVSLAVGVAWKGLGAYYVASSASGQVPDADNFTRILYMSALYPFYGPIPLAFAPLTGTVESRTPTSTQTLDPLAGAYFAHELGRVQASYTGTGNLHASVRATMGPFASIVAGDGDPIIRAGLEDAGRDLLPEEIGLISAFYRDLPFGQLSSPGDPIRLRTAHAGLKNIGGAIDGRFTTRLNPDPGIAEITGVLHNKYYHPNDEYDDTQPIVGVAGGIVGLPAQYSMGMPAATLPSWRFDAGVRYTGSDVGLFLFDFEIMMNDAEQLDLFPFARNAVSYSLFITVQ